MPKNRRQIKSGECYEICFRARTGLPLAVTRYMHVILEGVIARTQRDFKVDLSHDVWLGNHPHILIVAKDAEQARRFHAELKKKITDSVKQLLGLDFLHLWESSGIIRIGDLKSAIKMIAYYYANPTAAHLVDTIEEYPGLSSWADFLKNTDRLDAKIVREVLWIRLPTISVLPAHTVSETQDVFYTARLLERNKKNVHSLTRSPNAWMKCFNITTDEEVAKVNAMIITRLRRNEDVARRWRQRKGWRVMGQQMLYAQPIMAQHKPKKRERRIYCIAATLALRVALISEFKAFDKRCRYCYESWKKGCRDISWPPGAYLPPLSPLANAVDLRPS